MHGFASAYTCGLGRGEGGEGRGGGEGKGEEGGRAGEEDCIWGVGRCDRHHGAVGLRGMVLEHKGWGCQRLLTGCMCAVGSYGVRRGAYGCALFRTTTCLCLCLAGLICALCVAFAGASMRQVRTSKVSYGIQWRQVALRTMASLGTPPLCIQSRSAIYVAV